MAYETLAKLVQQGGSIYFAALFAVGLAYAVWPGNKDAFDRAKRTPLDDGGEHD
jgi:cytochrome c oxidase cbb3-type subunit 4